MSRCRRDVSVHRGLSSARVLFFSFFFLSFFLGITIEASRSLTLEVSSKVYCTAASGVPSLAPTPTTTGASCASYHCVLVPSERIRPRWSW